MPYLIGRWPPQLCLSAVSPFVEYSICVITCSIVTRKLNEYGHMNWKTKSDYVLTLNILGHQIQSIQLCIIWFRDQIISV